MEALIVLFIVGFVIMLFVLCFIDKPQETSVITNTSIPLRENTKVVFEALYLNRGKQLTAGDIANITGLDVKQVNGIFTSALQRKGLGAREEVTVQGGKIRLLHLTPEGIRFWESQK